MKLHRTTLLQIEESLEANPMDCLSGQNLLAKAMSSSRRLNVVDGEETISSVYVNIRIL